MRVTLPKVKGPTIKGTVRMPIWFSPSPCLYTIPHCIPASCWCWYCCLVTKLCLTHLQTHGLYSLPGFSVHGIFQARILERVANFLLLGIFWTQGLNLGLLHCRQILYCLSHRGNPKYLVLKVYSFIHVAIHLISKYLLNTFYRQRTVLGLGNPVWRWCCPHARRSLQSAKFQGG